MSEDNQCHVCLEVIFEEDHPQHQFWHNMVCCGKPIHDQCLVNWNWAQRYILKLSEARCGHCRTVYRRFRPYFINPSGEPEFFTPEEYEEEVMDIEEIDLTANDIIIESGATIVEEDDEVEIIRVIPLIDISQEDDDDIIILN